MIMKHPYETFIFDEPAPGVGRVTLNRPARLNAINIRMLDEFDHLFKWLSGRLPGPGAPDYGHGPGLLPAPISMTPMCTGSRRPLPIPNISCGLFRKAVTIRLKGD